MPRHACLPVAALLFLVSGPVSGQSFTITARDGLPPGALWVSMELASPVSVKVDLVAGSEPVAPSLQFNQVGVSTLRTSTTRALRPNERLEVRYGPFDPKLVRRVGASTKLYPDGTAMNTRITAVHCDGTVCRFCYELQEESAVDFDSFPQSAPNAVRNDFDNGLRARGNRQADWDQRDDAKNRVSPGMYFAKFLAAPTAASSTTEARSPFFALPAAPPSTQQCP